MQPKFWPQRINQQNEIISRTSLWSVPRVTEIRWCWRRWTPRDRHVVADGSPAKPYKPSASSPTDHIADLSPSCPIELWSRGGGSDGGVLLPGVRRAGGGGRGDGAQEDEEGPRRHLLCFRHVQEQLPVRLLPHDGFVLPFRFGSRLYPNRFARS